jgi:diguanylate cyclase (GGDEF)-like protein
MQSKGGPGKRRGRHFLVLRFALTSAVLGALFGAVLVSWLSGFIRTTNINHAKDTATYSMHLAVESLGISAQSPRPGVSATQYAVITRFLESVVATGKYVGSTAWSPPNLIAYAVEPGRTGKFEPVRKQVTEALHGQVEALVVHSPTAGIPDQTERSGLRTAGPLLELLVPVHVGGKVAAAVEFYQPWRPVEARIDKETNQMLWLVGGGLAVFWVGLLGFVLSASRDLKAQAFVNWQLASHDPLTGLPNRKLLRERVEQALRSRVRSGHKLGLLLFDLDRFKDVNDTLGHHSGDLLLEQVGPRLRGLLRDGDSVARLGGDEFVVLLLDLADASQATLAAERVSAALREPFQLDDVTVNIEASLGVAISPEHGTDFETLLQNADLAMYAAKTSGAAFAHYTPRKDRETIRKLALHGPPPQPETSDQQGPGSLSSRS